MIESIAYIALGSNIEPRLANLRSALTGLCNGKDIVCVDRSAIYETEPVGGPPGQALYYNTAIKVSTSLTAPELLARCIEVETRCGRVRTVPNGPRTIDLDILLFGSEIHKTPNLEIPHPRLHVRRFVLTPLAEIAGDNYHPLSNATIAQLLDRLACDDTHVRRVDERAWDGRDADPSS